MSPTAFGITILLISTVAAILAGVAVFTNITPEPPKDDPRVDTVLADLAEIKATLEEIQKTLLLMERKIEKDANASRAGIMDHIDNGVITLEKFIQDHVGD
jgi:hypothetical protein